MFPLDGKNLAQAGGSVISYARRYSFAAMLGIVTGEDDDGANQDHPQNKAPQQKVDNRKKDALAIMRDMGLVEPDASMYAQNEMAKHHDVNTLLSNLTDLKNGGYYWDNQSHQFLKRELKK